MPCLSVTSIPPSSLAAGPAEPASGVALSMGVEEAVDGPPWRNGGCCPDVAALPVVVLASITSSHSISDSELPSSFSKGTIVVATVVYSTDSATSCCQPCLFA